MTPRTRPAGTNDYAPNSLQRSHSDQDLAVGSGEPPIRLLDPLAPRRGDVLQLGARRVPALGGLLGDPRVEDAIRPHAAPPSTFSGRGVAPDRRTRRHILRSGVVGPREQAASGIRLRPVRPGDRAIDLLPTVEPRVFGVPQHPRV